MVAIEPPTSLANIPGPSSKDKDKSPKPKETPVSKLDAEKPRKSSRMDEDDITKIREKHAQEKAAASYAIVSWLARICQRDLPTS